LGTEAFLEKLKDILYKQEEISEIPRIQRFVARPSLTDLFNIEEGVLPKSERNRLIQEAHVKHGYSLKEISNVLHVHYTTISKVFYR